MTSRVGMTRCGLVILATGLATGVLGLSACKNAANVITPEEWETLVHFPDEHVTTIATSPEGALFVATTGGLYRYLPQRGPLERVVEQRRFLIGLYTPSAQAAYALDRTSRIYRWREDETWEEMRTPLSDSVISDGDFVHPVVLNRIWGTHEQNVFLVGGRGTVLHFDGKSWSLEDTPLVAIADSLPYEARLWAVGGASMEVFAAGMRVLSRRPDGSWLEVPSPASPSRFLAIAGTDAGVLLAGLTSVLRLRGGRWETVVETIPSFRSTIIWGGSQNDGSALFANSTGEVIGIVGGSTKTYRFTPFIDFRGAVALDSFLYIAGRTPEAGVVARVRR